MTSRVILIDMPDNRPSQAALVVDGRLEDLLLDPKMGDDTPAPGLIYWAKIDRLVPNIGGAFVKLTPKHMGFLREAKGIKSGEGILVQVSTYPEPGKATPVTTRLLYKGTRIIHTPATPGINVSRKIRSVDERDRLTDCVANWQPSGDLPEELKVSLSDMHRAGGFIIRSAANGAEKEWVDQDVMLTLTTRHLDEAKTTLEPGRGSSSWDTAAARATREWFDHSIEMIAINDAHEADFRTATNARNFGVDRYLEPFVSFDKGDPFEHFGVLDEIDLLRQPRVDLPSGAWMAIEATRAMVTVDVNTGDQFGGGAAMTANIETARELPRQLRLRGLGGQVTIDFAPMKTAHRKRIEETLKTAFRRDPVDTTLAGWTPLGNFELQRKRERRPLSELL